MRYSCPHCGSQQYKKLTALYEELNQVYTGKGITYGFGVGNNGIVDYTGVTRTTYRNQSDLIRKVAPPIKPKFGNPGTQALLLAITGVIVLKVLIQMLIYIHLDSKSASHTAADGAGTIAACIIQLGLAGFLVKAFFSNRAKFKKEWPQRVQTYEQQLEQWNRRYRCDTCGDIFETAPLTQSQLP